jgi:hypothetical protein
MGGVFSFTVPPHSVRRVNAALRVSGRPNSYVECCSIAAVLPRWRDVRCWFARRMQSPAAHSQKLFPEPYPSQGSDISGDIRR